MSAPMTPERWQRIKELLDEIEAAPPEHRQRLLEQGCAGDAELRAEVEPFLADVDEQFIGTVIARGAADWQADDLQSAGFGRYRLVRRIGQGGMGAVFEAVRTDDFRKRVALKLIKQEFDSGYARERFQQERQLLASLEHPYIARLLDGGETDSGSPYLVLEFVEGEPIDRYCEKLDRVERLGLFLKVCDAVGYAHRSLVVHRDLKPANILVTSNGDPRLLDFGIAKLLDSDTARTQTALVAFTPDYASPEQVRGQPITTASDVYSLGVVLYQMLTGGKPYAIDTLTPLEMDRVICQEAPAAPGIGDELDHILLMALRKEPERRYGSVADFAADINRFLTHQAVKARPDSLSYRVRKFTRRHAFALAACFLVVASLATGLGAALYQARIAKERFADARELANGFIAFDRQIMAISGTVKARGILVGQALVYLDKLVAIGGADPALIAELATAYQKVADIQGSPYNPSLGMQAEGLRTYRKAQKLWERIASLKPQYARSLADCYLEISAYEEKDNDPHALESARQAAAIMEKVGPQGGVSFSDLAKVQGTLSFALAAARRDDEALTVLLRCLFWRRKAAEAEPGARTRYLLLRSETNLSQAYQRVGRLSEAAALLTKLLDELAAIHAAYPVDTRFGRLLTAVYAYRGAVSSPLELFSGNDSAGATGYFRSCMDLAEKQVSTDPNDRDGKYILAFCLSYGGSVESALRRGSGVAELKRAAGIFQDLVAKTHAYDFAANHTLAEALYAHALQLAGRGADAARAADAAIADQRELLKTAKDPVEGLTQLVRNLRIAGEAAALGGRNAQAEALLAEAAHSGEQLASRAPAHLGTMMYVGQAWRSYGRFLRTQGQAEQGEIWLRGNEAIWKSWPSPSELTGMLLRDAQDR